MRNPRTRLIHRAEVTEQRGQQILFIEQLEDFAAVRQFARGARVFRGGLQMFPQLGELRMARAFDQFSSVTRAEIKAWMSARWRSETQRAESPLYASLSSALAGV